MTAPLTMQADWLQSEPCDKIPNCTHAWCRRCTESFPSQPPHKQRQSWVDPAYWFSQGELQYIGPAGPQTKRKLGLS